MTTTMFVVVLVLAAVVCLLLANARFPHRCEGMVVRSTTMGLSQKQCTCVAVNGRIYCEAHLRVMNDGVKRC